MSQRSDFTETRVDLEEIFSGDVLKLERHKVLLPDGNQAHREVVRHPGEDGEFIECVPVKIQDAAEMVRKGEINDAKTATAIWWLSSGT